MLGKAWSREMPQVNREPGLVNRKPNKQKVNFSLQHEPTRRPAGSSAKATVRQQWDI